MSGQQGLPIFLSKVQHPEADAAEEVSLVNEGFVCLGEDVVVDPGAVLFLCACVFISVCVYKCVCVPWWPYIIFPS